METCSRLKRLIFNVKILSISQLKKKTSDNNRWRICQLNVCKYTITFALIVRFYEVL